MMYKIVLFLCWCCISSVTAQIPFALASQTGTLLHPSLAGAKEKSRFLTSFNYRKSDTKTEQNYLASFDKVSRTLSSGIGAYFLYQHTAEPPLKDAPEALKSVQKSGSDRYHLGVALAPKYNILHKRNPNKIAWTISPSLIAEYQFASLKHRSESTFEEFYRTFYSSAYPTGMFLTDSVLIRADQINNNMHQASLGVGLQLNSENMLILYRFRYSLLKSSETLHHFWYNDATLKLSETVMSSRSTLTCVSQELTFGITLPKRKGSMVSLTPMTGIGFSYYPYISIRQSLQAEKSRHHFADHQVVNRWQYKHASLHLRYQKFLTGFHCTGTAITNYYGASLGYQLENAKVLSCFFKDKQNGFFGELSLQLFLN